MAGDAGVGISLVHIPEEGVILCGVGRGDWDLAFVAWFTFTWPQCEKFLPDPKRHTAPMGTLGLRAIL